MTEEQRALLQGVVKLWRRNGPNQCADAIHACLAKAPLQSDEQTSEILDAREDDVGLEAAGYLINAAGLDTDAEEHEKHGWPGTAARARTGAEACRILARREAASAPTEAQAALADALKLVHQSEAVRLAHLGNRGDAAQYADWIISRRAARDAAFDWLRTFGEAMLRGCGE